jgi:hypothetical protein
VVRSSARALGRHAKKEGEGRANEVGGMWYMFPADFEVGEGLRVHGQQQVEWSASRAVPLAGREWN